MGTLTTLPIPVSTIDVALTLSDLYPATTADIKARRPGLCVFVVKLKPEEDGTEKAKNWLAATAISRAPRLINKLAEGQNPLHCDTALLKRLKEGGVEYQPVLDDEEEMVENPRDEEQHTEDNEECIICLENPPLLMWSNCSHASNPKIVCESCGDIIIKKKK